MTASRPILNNPFKYRFPITAIISIGHRLTGVVLFFAIPCALWAMCLIQSSPANFAHLSMCLQTFIGKLGLWLVMVSLAYHVLAGIRHLTMDCGFAESLVAAKISSWLVVGLAVIVMVIVGGWLWV